MYFARGMRWYISVRGHLNSFLVAPNAAAFPAAAKAGMIAAKGKNPPLILFMRLLWTVRRLALKGMMRI